MKRIILVGLVFVFCFGGIANAEIGTQVDKFTNAKEIYSSFRKDQYEAGVGLVKRLENKDITYEISFGNNVSYGEQYLKEDPVELKIDEKPIVNLSVKETLSIGTNINNKNERFITLHAIIPQNVIEDILKAKRVAVKAYKNTTPDIVVLPDNVLEEWKQVIRMEK